MNKILVLFLILSSLSLAQDTVKTQSVDQQVVKQQVVEKGMSDGVLIALITSSTSIVLGIITLLITLVNNRKVEEVKKATDGLTKQLVEKEKIISKDEGIAEEKQRAIVETSNIEKGIQKEINRNKGDL